MKVCYFIQTHKNLQQINRLTQTIKRLSPYSQIIISHDSKHCNFDFTSLKSFSGVNVLQAQRARGDFSLVQGYLDAVDWLFKQNIEFDWLINLTGQDYPTQPLSQIESLLAESDCDGFIEHFKVFSEQSHWSIQEGGSRYLYRYQKLGELAEWKKNLLNPLKVVNYIQPFFRVNFSYDIRIGVKTLTPFNENFICYGGSFFSILSKKCIQYLYDFSKSRSDIVDYYKGVTSSDESFIQTVLVNSQLFNLSNDCKRYFDFSGTRNGRPRILTIHDYPSLLQNNINFARKFDIEQDSKILDALDARILNNS